jgi:hypothetical protein
VPGVIAGSWRLGGSEHREKELCRGRLSEFTPIHLVSPCLSSLLTRFPLAFTVIATPNLRSRSSRTTHRHGTTSEGSSLCPSLSPLHLSRADIFRIFFHPNNHPQHPHPLFPPPSHPVHLCRFPASRARHPVPQLRASRRVDGRSERGRRRSGGFERGQLPFPTTPLFLLYHSGKGKRDSSFAISCA